MGSDATSAKPKILLVDDDQDFLEIYWEILKTIPSAPEVHTASTGARALAMLESEPFQLLLVDLNMPKMDGLQVISIARRKYPHLRIVVWTAIADEQFRVRAYGMGVDQYWQKPGTDEERKHCLDAVEVMLRADLKAGFRGVQSKSLVDLIQLECLSQNTVMLRINNGALTGQIWITNGELMDAQTEGRTGEAAFRTILGWKTGSFELLHGDEHRERAIFSSYHALLLEVAQAMDEAVTTEGDQAVAENSPLLGLTRFSGVQWVINVANDSNCPLQSWGVESPDVISDWASQSLEAFNTLGERLHFGPLQQLTGISTTHRVAIAASPRGELTVGFRQDLRSDEIRETMRNILAKWAS